MRNYSNIILFYNTHHIIQKRIFKRHTYIILNKAFDYFIRPDRFDSSFTISDDQPARSQFYSSEITNYDNQYIRQSERIDLSEYRFSCCSRRFSVIIRTKVHTLMSQHIRPTNVSGIIILLLIYFKVFLNFI